MGDIAAWEVVRDTATVCSDVSFGDLHVEPLQDAPFFVTLPRGRSDIDDSGDACSLRALHFSPQELPSESLSARDIVHLRAGLGGLGRIRSVVGCGWRSSFSSWLGHLSRALCVGQAPRHLMIGGTLGQQGAHCAGRRLHRHNAPGPANALTKRVHIPAVKELIVGRLTTHAL